MEQIATCCFTGHRPDKLPWGSDEEDVRCVALKKRLTGALERAYDAGYRHFICGMARGCDLYFAEGVLTLRERHADVTLEGARPCETQALSWPEREKRRYEAILDRCDLETLVQYHYDRGCMKRRNRYMVDRAALLIAVYDGSPKGGTAQTLNYARKCGLDIEILRPE